MDMGRGVIVGRPIWMGISRPGGMRSVAVTAMPTVAEEVHGDEGYADHHPEPVRREPGHWCSPVTPADRRSAVRRPAHERPATRYQTRVGAAPYAGGVRGLRSAATGGLAAMIALERSPGESPWGGQPVNSSVGMRLSWRLIGDTGRRVEDLSRQD